MPLVIMEWFVVCLDKLSREHVFGDGRGITLTGKGSENRRFSEIVLFQDARAQVVLKRDAHVLLRVQGQVIKVRLL